MKKIILFLILLVSSFNMIGQTCPTLSTTGGSVTCTTPCVTLTSTVTPLHATDTYSVSSITYAPFSYTTGTSVSTSTDDIFTTGITIPFCFNFFGNSYTTLYIGSNGNVSFNSAVSGAFCPWSISGPLPGSNSNSTKNCIMSPLCDIYPPAGGGTIKYTTYGSAPCRQFVISYNNLPMFLPGSYCTGDSEQSQIVLYETSNIIDVYIGKHNSPTLCTSWNYGYAITGIENAAGTIYYTAPGQNGTAFTAVNQGWRFSPAGSAYTWTTTWSSGSTTVCPTTTTTYTCTATTTTPCGTVTLTNTALVNVVSTAVSISGPNVVCVGSTINLTTTGAGGAWTSTNTAVATVNTSGVVTGNSPGTSWIRYNSGSCADSILVTVNPTYLNNVSATICANQTYTFNGGVYNSTGVYTNHYYTIKGCDSIWTLNLTVNPTYNTTIDRVICKGDTFKFAGFDYTTSGIYTHTFTTIKGCDSNVTLNLIVKDLPELTFSLLGHHGFKGGCPNDSLLVALTSHSSDITDYTWNFSGATILTASSNHGGPYTISYPTNGIYIISVVATNGLCQKEFKDTIKIDEPPIASIKPVNQEFCFGESVLFIAQNLQFQYYYTWSPSTSFYPVNSDDLHNGWAYGIVDTSKWITLTVRSPFWCEAKDSIWVDAHSCCELVVPTAFSPNDDGKNDKFGPVGGYYKLHEFVVKNRWGQTVFETANKESKWDGTFNGVPQDLGVYFWFVIYECDGKQYLQKGDVTLVR